MHHDHAELSALATRLDDLTDRVTAVADSHVGTPTEDMASDLYEVERSLHRASRRLNKVLRSTR